MCSFLFSTKYKKENIQELNFFLKPRGPDHTEVKFKNDYLFIHNLLSITGSFAPQPYEQGDVTLLYNGEIYNYQEFGEYRSDGECIIPLYKKIGNTFTQHLDGEFAICLIDHSRDIAIISSDIFKTKPLYIGYNKNESLGCASYKTPLSLLGFDHIYKAEPNCTYVFDLKSFKLIDKFSIYNFDLEQHKSSYEDWCTTFINAVKKRVIGTEKNIFIGLSSGYDSGIIYQILNDLNKNFYTFTLNGSENVDILNQRLALKSNYCKSIVIEKNSQDYSTSNKHITDFTEDFIYTIHSSSSSYTEYVPLNHDQGSNNFATICREAKKQNCKICLSGTGADEIISDYGFNGTKIYNHSNFGGKFPNNLKTIFPWASFYGSTLESYIAKEEYVGGSFGIEMRYPFLDKALVQEFLWLHQDLKNKEYKAPIDYYFAKNNFPYAKQEKRGF
jgi:asparagine synthetase B (glutamine-hydrolysing)